MSYRVYLVEDEPSLNNVLASYLRKEGWEVRSFLTGEEARRAIPDRPHLWILDKMLPDIDGYRLIREIKGVSPDVPVIFISARDADLDRVVGLEMGSDDYISKPFLPRELVIRAAKLLSRTYRGAEKVIFLPPYSIDEAGRTVTRGGETLDLTSKEFDLLLVMARAPGRAFSRQALLDLVWGEDYFGTDRVVDDLVRRLRKKLPELRVETIYGYGYRVVRP